MTRPDDLERLAAYALGTLHGDDRRAVEQLAAADADARVELDGYRAAVALLDADEAPRPEVWDRVTAAIAADPDAPPVSILAARRRAGRGRVLVAAAAAALLAVTAWGVGRLRTASPATATVSLQQEARQAAATSGARQLTVASPDATSFVRVILLPDGRGFVVGGVLANTDGATTYALYATTAGRPVLVAVLGTTLHLVTFQLPRDAVGLAVGVTDGLDAVQAAVTPAPGSCASCTSGGAPGAGAAPASGGGAVPAPAPPAPASPTGKSSGGSAQPSGGAQPLLPPLTVPTLPRLPVPQHLLP